MPPPLRTLILAAVFAATAACGRAWTLPLIEGQVSGELQPLLFPGAPPLHWQVKANVGSGPTRHVVLAATGKGIRLNLEADVKLPSVDGDWALTDCVIDADPWLSAALAKFGGTNLATEGRLTLSGRGHLQHGVPAGSVQARWDRGVLRDPQNAWKLEGVQLTAVFEFNAADGSVRNPRPATVEVQTITTTRFGARNLKITGQLVDLSTFAVAAAAIEIAGGRVDVAPCNVMLQPFSVAANLRISGVGLQDVAALVPGTVSEALGRVDGDVQLAWSTASGFKLGAGRLSLSHDEPAMVRLAPSPGLITSSLPPTVLKYYPGLGQIETGKVPIRAEMLDVTFTPKGDADGRTASVHLTGGPVDPTLRAPIDLTVNIRGPLESLIEMGTSSKLHFGKR